ncbi:MAG: VTT domain-containing protein [Bacteroidales bacterium]|nr:VTT domain-containing protein [Bacteroidales bacterium]MDD3664673.1 VTT domain-containing protein [Bacteroidales bacterium]
MKLFNGLTALWETDRAYFILIAAAAVLPWSLSGMAGWLLAGDAFQLAEKPAFQAGFFIITTLTMAAGLSPTTVVATAAGFFFGWAGFPWVVMSYLAAAILGRKIGVFLNIHVAGSKKFVNPRAGQFFAQMSNKPFLLLVFCRLSPVLTFALTNVALGRMSFKITTYAAATLIGMLPRTLLVFFAGTQASEWSQAFESGEINHFKLLLALCLLVISIVGIGVIARQAFLRISEKK